METFLASPRARAENLPHISDPQSKGRKGLATETSPSKGALSIGTLLFAALFIFLEKMIDCRVPNAHLSRDSHLINNLSNPLSGRFDWFREFRRQ